MGFTTQIFMYAFFPLFLLMYFLLNYIESVGKIGAVFVKCRIKDLSIIAASFVFYVFAGIIGVVQLLFLIVLMYVLARIIDCKRDNKKVAKVVYIVGICLLVSNLIYYKYAGFIVSNIIGLFRENPVMLKIMGPLGISFITFSAISYLTDVYRKDATAGSFIDCVLYVTFFPKIVSGPIVLWKNFQNQISTRVSDTDKIINGINRIMIGVAKKVLLADVFGKVVDSMSLGFIDQPTAFLAIVLYWLQIYFDFSGYSDMAIGISGIMGFEFDENFNFPYRSMSISEFWRRWHISLGTWFRQYIYFPLGGSRKGKTRTMINLGVVFALTGIWHGAGWNYILWGAANGILVIVEHMIADKEFYKNVPNWIKHVVTTIIVACSWQLFKYQSIKQAAKSVLTALGILKADTVFYTWQYYLNNRLILFMIIAIIGATFMGNKKVKEIYDNAVKTKTGYIVQEFALMLIFAVSLIFMISSTYSPFIYFQY